MTPREKIESIRTAKSRGEKVAALTAYDFPMAKLLDEAGVDLLLVGDSLGMVVLGYPDTTHVTMADMLHHTRAVHRGAPDAAVIADLPYRSYETVENALANSHALVEAGATGVKLEGALPEVVHALVAADIPVMGHLGMLPQHVHEEGGYRRKGRDEEEARQILADAQALEKAGAFSIVLETVVSKATANITAALTIPTIGIGSGEKCQGQVLVTHDLIGAFPWFTPKFVTPAVHTGEAIVTAVSEYVNGVKR